MNLRNVTAAACLSFVAAACVPKADYTDAVNTADRARMELVKRMREDVADRARLEQQIQSLEQALQDTQRGRASMQQQLDEATVVDEQLSKELERLGRDSQSLLAANDGLKQALESSRKRLEELRHAQAAAEGRAALYRDVALKLKSMIDAGDLAVVLREGRMILRMSNDVLFDSGKAELKPAGKRALAEVAEVLRTISGRRFQVAGHTDNEPIRFSPFRSNWELSAARGLSVVGFLVGQGMDPHVVSAAGYGEFDPIDSNDAIEGRTHNRRTEIALLPDIDEIVSVPEAR